MIAISIKDKKEDMIWKENIPIFCVLEVCVKRENKSGNRTTKYCLKYGEQFYIFNLSNTHILWFIGSNY